MDASEVRRLLADAAASATARHAALRDEVAAIVAQVASEAPDDEHDPDGATTGFERARAMRLRDDAAARLAAVAAAHTRLRDGTYGLCEACGTTIPDERLRARPTATSCVRCAASGGT